MRAAIYARVSTSNVTQTCENQLLELRRYCDARGWEIHAEFTDEMSGAKDRRPGWIASCSTLAGASSPLSCAGHLTGSDAT
jgi:DNA invertase Pin-like site-specific DNA recombinase